MKATTPPTHELILGGQKSGKTRRAEDLARAWLAQDAAHRVLYLATAQMGDDEMRERIARHQRDRAERVPGLQTIEVDERLAEAIRTHSRPDTLLVVDCLTLWLTRLMMPLADADADFDSPFGGVKWSFDATKKVANEATSVEKHLCQALTQASGPVVLVSNEIGWGVIPLGREVRAFVDALGRLNQSVAAQCQRVTLMTAGLPLMLKGQS